MKKLIIKGDFELSGDALPVLEECVKRMKYAEIEIVEYPIARLVQFSGIKEKKEAKI